MNDTHTTSDGQLAFSETKYSFLSIPSRLKGFNNSDTTVSGSVSGCEERKLLPRHLRLVSGSVSGCEVFCLNGKLELAE